MKKAELLKLLDRLSNSQESIREKAEADCRENATDFVSSTVAYLDKKGLRVTAKGSYILVAMFAYGAFVLWFGDPSSSISVVEYIGLCVGVLLILLDFFAGANHKRGGFSKRAYARQCTAQQMVNEVIQQMNLSELLTIFHLSELQNRHSPSPNNLLGSRILSLVQRANGANFVEFTATDQQDFRKLLSLPSGPMNTEIVLEALRILGEAKDNPSYKTINKLASRKWLSNSQDALIKHRAAEVQTLLADYPNHRQPANILLRPSTSVPTNETLLRPATSADNDPSNLLHPTETPATINMDPKS